MILYDATWTYIYIYIMCVCMCMYICIYIYYVCMCMYMYIYILCVCMYSYIYFNVYVYIIYNYIYILYTWYDDIWWLQNFRHAWNCLDVLCLWNENDRDLFQTCCTACAAQTWANWSQFTYLLGHLHSFHASTNVHSVIEKSPKSNPTNLCAWQAPPPTRALPLSSSNTANHEHMAHMAGHWLSQNEKSNANWCKLTIQSSAWQKTWSECSGLCIQHGMRSCQ